jgi:hypothetical protein
MQNNRILALLLYPNLDFRWTTFLVPIPQLSGSDDQDCNPRVPWKATRSWNVFTKSWQTWLGCIAACQRMRSGITARTICGECSLGGAPESKAIDYGVDGNLARVFQVEDLVSCFVQRRSRTKASDVWSAPMRVIAKLGDRNYAVCNGRRKKTVHINDIKRVSLPSGSGWKLNTTLMEECQRDWQLDSLGVEAFLHYGGGAARVMGGSSPLVADGIRPGGSSSGQARARAAGVCRGAGAKFADHVLV